jgi:hypothetical protein
MKRYLNSCFLGIGGIVDHRCLEVIVCFLGIGGIVDHHSLEVIVCFVGIGGIAPIPRKQTITSKQ